MTPDERAQDAVHLANDVAERIAELVNGIPDYKVMEALARWRDEHDGSRPLAVPAWFDRILRGQKPPGRPRGSGNRPA